MAYPLWRLVFLRDPATEPVGRAQPAGMIRAPDATEALRLAYAHLLDLHHTGRPLASLVSDAAVMHPGVTLAVAPGGAER